MFVEVFRLNISSIIFENLPKYEVKLLWSFVEEGGKFAEMSVFFSSSQSTFCILIVSSNHF